MTTPTPPAAPETALLPCPFCGNSHAVFKRIGTSHQSCVVQCEYCGTTHESNEVGEHCGKSWNTRAATAEVARLRGKEKGYIIRDATEPPFMEATTKAAAALAGAQPA